jgi:Zn-dependent protease
MSLVDLFVDRVISFIPVLLSLTVHEWAHAWTAWKLGDDTAKMLGRVSLNPLDHIDPVGTLLLPLLGIPFGWANPVPINPTRFHRNISMPMGVLITAAAGPISNLLIATLAFGVFAWMNVVLNPHQPNGLDTELFLAITQFLRTLIIINVMLATFNLLPIPPLDGSRIAEALMPTWLRPAWSQFTSLGPIALILVLLLPGFLGFSILAIPFQWVTDLLARVSR